MVFIVIRHGDNRETLFNANCMVASLLDNIKHRCGLDKATSIDLCDDNGCMHQLEENLKDYASKFMKEREKYVLVKKEKSGQNEVKYTSLLNGLHRTDPELLGLIEGRPKEVEETPQPPVQEHIERKKSTKVPEKRLSVSLSVKRKGRIVNKLF